MVLIYNCQYHVTTRVQRCCSALGERDARDRDSEYNYARGQATLGSFGFRRRYTPTARCDYRTHPSSSTSHKPETGLPGHRIEHRTCNARYSFQEDCSRAILEIVPGLALPIWVCQFPGLEAHRVQNLKGSSDREERRVVVRDSDGPYCRDRQWPPLIPS
ncbi:hypothetical protein BC827DRAFT_450750 [Russula dissimulans]|nr:hypothetical protein BC827DRAFT_450750 [Russula dissimulans]